MGKPSDPIREFTDLCLALRTNNTGAGANFLAEHFGVEPWSSEFFQILGSIHARITSLAAMLNATELDEDIKSMATQQLETIRSAFSNVGLQNAWDHSLQHYLTNATLQPIRMASMYVRPIYGYEIPSEDEIADVKADVESLLDWLREADLADKDFIRKALIEGIESFLLRLEKLNWLGWPETLSGLRDVVAAYMALDRGDPGKTSNPPYAAMLKKVGETLCKVFSVVKSTKDVQEVGDWVLRGFGALHVVGAAASPVAGLLVHLPSN